MSRNQQAEHVARTLYDRIPQSPAQQMHQSTNPNQPLLPSEEHVINYDTLPPVSTDYVPPEKRKVCCGTVSPVRRTFCLVVTFDLIMTCVLWVIYAQGKESSSKKLAFLEDEIANYTFKTSLFDTVICAGARTSPLLLSYALFHLSNASVVAITTAGTSVFIVVKIFLFSWPTEKDNFMVYIVIIASLVIAWAETWMLDFKVLPRERKAAATEAYRRSIYHRPTPAWMPTNAHSYAPSEFFSIPPSRDEPREGIDVTGAYRDRGDSESSLLLTQDPEAVGYQRMAAELLTTVQQLMATDDWKASGCQHGCTVTYKHVSGIGKTFRLQAVIESTVHHLYQILVVNGAEAPVWNPTMVDCRVLQTIDYHTDICYNVSADALKGAVKSRDFVDLRHWRSVGDSSILTVGCSVEYKAMPPQPGRVRGQNRIIGWLLESANGTTSSTNITWIVSTDLKGWMPQSVSDAALTGVMIDFVKYLRLHLGCASNSA